jgi:cobalt-zinc-cadmium efflux system membrane fusion protein
MEVLIIRQQRFKIKDMKKITYTISILILLIVVGCGQSNKEDAHGEEDEHAHDKEKKESKDEVHLLQKQMDVMGIELGKFQYLNLSTTVKSSGQLELPPQNKASLSAVMGGRVKSILILEGDYVKKGQTLALLEHPDFIEMQEEYMTARSKFTFIEKDYDRKKKLYEEKITSDKEFQQAEADYQSAKAKVNGLKAKLEMLDINVSRVEKGEFLSTIPIRSPLNGYVRMVEINIGKYVEPQQEMFEIVDNEHIHIDLMVYEKDMWKVKNGQKVIFSLTSSPDSVFQGSIFAVGKAFEKDSKALQVHAEIDNKKGDLLPGMYVDARIVTNEEKVRAVPNDAIVSDGGLNYIFVRRPAPISKKHKHDEGKDHSNEYLFRKIEVSVGATDIGFTEVVPAYKMPDSVPIVTKGAFYLLAEMKKGEGGHGHHH